MREDENNTPAFKRISIERDRYSVGRTEKEAYEHYVHLTSRIIGRSFIQTAKLIEHWPLEKIIRRYEECTKHAGQPPEGKTMQQWQAILWWSKRKREKAAGA